MDAVAFAEWKRNVGDMLGSVERNLTGTPAPPKETAPVPAPVPVPGNRGRHTDYRPPVQRQLPPAAPHPQQPQSDVYYDASLFWRLEGLAEAMQSFQQEFDLDRQKRSSRERDMTRQLRDEFDTVAQQARSETARCEGELRQRLSRLEEMVCDTRSAFVGRDADARLRAAPDPDSSQWDNLVSRMHECESAVSRQRRLWEERDTRLQQTVAREMEDRVSLEIKRLRDVSRECAQESAKDLLKMRFSALERDTKERYDGLLLAQQEVIALATQQSSAAATAQKAAVTALGQRTDGIEGTLQHTEDEFSRLREWKLSAEDRLQAVERSSQDERLRMQDLLKATEGKLRADLHSLVGKLEKQVTESVLQRLGSDLADVPKRSEFMDMYASAVGSLREDVQDLLQSKNSVRGSLENLRETCDLRLRELEKLSQSRDSQVADLAAFKESLQRKFDRTQQQVADHGRSMEGAVGAADRASMACDEFSGRLGRHDESIKELRELCRQARADVRRDTMQQQNETFACIKDDVERCKVQTESANTAAEAAVRLAQSLQEGRQEEREMLLESRRLLSENAQLVSGMQRKLLAFDDRIRECQERPGRLSLSVPDEGGVEALWLRVQQIEQSTAEMDQSLERATDTLKDAWDQREKYVLDRMKKEALRSVEDRIQPLNARITEQLEDMRDDAAADQQRVSRELAAVHAELQRSMSARRQAHVPATEKHIDTASVAELSRRIAEVEARAADVAADVEHLRATAPSPQRQRRAQDDHRISRIEDRLTAVEVQARQLSPRRQRDAGQSPGQTDLLLERLARMEDRITEAEKGLLSPVRPSPPDEDQLQALRERLAQLESSGGQESEKQLLLPLQDARALHELQKDFKWLKTSVDTLTGRVLKASKTADEAMATATRPQQLGTRPPLPLRRYGSSDYVSSADDRAHGASTGRTVPTSADEADSTGDSDSEVPYVKRLRDATQARLDDMDERVSSLESAVDQIVQTGVSVVAVPQQQPVGSAPLAAAAGSAAADADAGAAAVPGQKLPAAAAPPLYRPARAVPATAQATDDLCAQLEEEMRRLHVDEQASVLGSKCSASTVSFSVTDPPSTYDKGGSAIGDNTAW